MSISNFIYSLRCPICRDFFSEPKQLRCGHTYCVECINRLKEMTLFNNGFIVKCSLCYEFTHFPSSGLKTNYVIRDIVENCRNNSFNNNLINRDLEIVGRNIRLENIRINREDLNTFSSISNSSSEFGIRSVFTANSPIRSPNESLRSITSNSTNDGFFDFIFELIVDSINFLLTRIEYFEFKNYKEKEEINCLLLKDNLAISAISRINTKYCKQLLKSKLCEINNLKYGPIERIENNCKEYFG
uniref:RING-type domain-containing protein n=1 Tax=Meloidogyne hapla TaxID=6305 RepID=A0A1I8C020_MELHA